MQARNASLDSSKCFSCGLSENIIYCDTSASGMACDLPPEFISPSLVLVIVSELLPALGVSGKLVAIMFGCSPPQGGASGCRRAQPRAGVGGQVRGARARNVWGPSKCWICIGFNRAEVSIPSLESSFQDRSNKHGFNVVVLFRSC